MTITDMLMVFFFVVIGIGAVSLLVSVLIGSWD